MSLMDYLKSQFLEIIQWQDDSRDTISFRFPDLDKEIKRGAQLIVRESQVAQFIYLGQFGDTFGPGKWSLTTDNIPILSTLKGWKYGFESPFKADVYFVNTRLFTGNKWGTANPVMMRDADLGIVRVRAYGTFDFHVVDPKLFLKEVAGTDDNFRLDEFADTMRSRIVSVFSDALASAKVPVLDVASRYQELGEALLPLINPAVTAKYGLEIPSFIVENVSVPPEVEQAIDKRASMSAVGNLNDYVKFQMAESMTKGEGGGMLLYTGIPVRIPAKMIAAPITRSFMRTPPPAQDGATRPTNSKRAFQAFHGIGCPSNLIASRREGLCSGVGRAYSSSVVPRRPRPARRASSSRGAQSADPSSVFATTSRSSKLPLRYLT